jgi:L,D-transpeptidase ErfK/SrfK
VIGVLGSAVTREEDTLIDIARADDLGYVEIVAANPGIDPWLLGAGVTVTLPRQFVLPDASHQGIVINLAELRLYYYPRDGSATRAFPLGIGGEGAQTPVGRSQLERKQTHPTWFPTESERAENPDLPASVPLGPDNPMGDYAHQGSGAPRVLDTGQRQSCEAAVSMPQGGYEIPHALRRSWYRCL